MGFILGRDSSIYLLYNIGAKIKSQNIWRKFVFLIFVIMKGEYFQNFSVKWSLGRIYCLRSFERNSLQGKMTLVVVKMLPAKSNERRNKHKLVQRT